MVIFTAIVSLLKSVFVLCLIDNAITVTVDLPELASKLGLFLGLFLGLGRSLKHTTPHEVVNDFSNLKVSILITVHLIEWLELL